MIITFLRSSSIQTHAICEHKYFCEYVLGMKPPSGKAADKGNILHKAMEILARVSICQRLGETSYEDETFGLLKIDETSPDWAVEQAYSYYTELSPHIIWNPSDLKDCRKWMHAILDYNGGQYDPRNLHVLQAEARFDFELEEDWANYKYVLPDGEVLTGRYGIKGTIDLVVEAQSDPKIIIATDYKTGARKDWSKASWDKKTYKELRYDPQLSLYHYALTRMYPDAEEIFLNILFINDGGIFSFCFEKNDCERTKRMLRNKFKQISETTVPRLNVGFACKFCHFAKTKSEQDPTKTICEFVRDKVKEVGIERTTQEIGIPGSYSQYGSGGGRRE